ncbi:4-hydroxy-tetrahydrodipicolinate synthase [Rhodopseudomonas rhenobacensis]|uniref:4-hydroxy-tetrahydrodipicolinate synthase n=1 Tax=Rhodopseudomonas rhenobacensis TaxID=87461 RepID=A0A7W7Z8J2_9BRAD|nr:dihydrodipicolinate synthase family protein [Rhodopseudomonas rhenobacensis]MBB5049958.1 4-hydroxy-tetrahydrodipicolinate synthase [Rhodopseudomonas rhenobacensis]
MKSGLLNERASGVFIIAATPFDDQGGLDLESTDRMIDFYLSCGVSGITMLGMMGEANKLSSLESTAFMKRVLARVANKVPVVVGVSHPGVDPLVEFSREAMDLGAAGVMIAPVSTLRTEENVLSYFAGVMQRLGPDVPVVVQDYPQSTLVNMSPATIQKMIELHPQFVMLKHEDCPGHSKLTRIYRGCQDGLHRSISIMVGNGGLYLPQELRRGASGAMTGFAYPEMLVAVCRLFAEQKPEAGEDLFDIYLPLVRHEVQPGLGLAIRKEALRRRGVIESSFVRAPGAKLTRDDLVELDSLMRRLERRLDSNSIRSKLA